MEHGTIRATILPQIITLIMEKYNLSEREALDSFYRSSTGESFSDDETGLYGQSPLFIFSLYEEEHGLKTKEMEIGCQKLNQL